MSNLTRNQEVCVIYKGCLWRGVYKYTEGMPEVIHMVSIPALGGTTYEFKPGQVYTTIAQAKRRYPNAQDRIDTRRKGEGDEVSHMTRDLS